MSCCLCLRMGWKIKRTSLTVGNFETYIYYSVSHYYLLAFDEDFWKGIDSLPPPGIAALITIATPNVTPLLPSVTRRQDFQVTLNEIIEQTLNLEDKFWFSSAISCPS